MSLFSEVLDSEQKALLVEVCTIALRAGQAVMNVYGRDFDQQEKEDKSPLTEADLASHNVIVEGISSVSSLPILSEEGKLPAWTERSEWQQYWIIDPLDGTKEFIKRNGEFTINIALVKQGVPVLGVVYAPALDELYLAAESIGSYKLTTAIDSSLEDAKSIKVCASAPSTWRIVGSRSHGSERMESFVGFLGDYQMVPMGSSLKLCMVAEGKADLYPRLAPTSEWDTAAAQAVVEQAGGVVLRDDLSLMRYNTKDDILNPHFIVCASVQDAWADFFR